MTYDLVHQGAGVFWFGWGGGHCTVILVLLDFSCQQGLGSEGGCARAGVAVAFAWEACCLPMDIRRDNKFGAQMEDCTLLICLHRLILKNTILL